MYEINVDLYFLIEEFLDVDLNESFEVIMELDYDVELEFSKNILIINDVEVEFFNVDLLFF